MFAYIVKLVIQSIISFFVQSAAKKVEEKVVEEIKELENKKEKDKKEK